jgi:TonB family protein
VITPNTEEGRVLLRWLEAEDPALASTTQSQADGKSLTMPTIQHAPSYLARQPVLRDIPSPPLDPAVPSAQPPAPVQAARRPADIAPIISPTLLRWSPELETRGALPGPEMKFTASGREAPQAAQFRVAVDENGTVPYCFVERSSGDAALDEQARKYLTLSRFAPIENRQSKIENDLTWGTATVEWGNDLAARPAKDESVAP